MLEACVDLMVERGLHSVTVDEISARSGVAKSTIYRHWSTRDEVIADAWRTMSPASTPAQSGDLDEDLRSLLGSLAERLDTPPLSVLLPELMAASERDPALAALFEQVLRDRRRPIGERLRRAVADGELPDALDVGLAVSLFVGPLLHRRLLQREQLSDRWLDQVARTVLTACRSGTVDSPQPSGTRA